MELVPASNAMEASSPLDVRNLGPVVNAAHLQYQRQLKTLQALQKQFELTAESNTAWRDRERRREEKYAYIDQERQTQRENLAEHSNRMAETRAARLEAANRHEEAVRAAAAAKVQAVEDRLARFEVEKADHAVSERQRIAALEAKREATYRANLQMLEGRRQSMLARERKMEEMMRQRDELRQLQAQIKAEEDFLREQQRRSTKLRAEGELAERVANFHAKAAAKDETTARRKKELEDMRRLRGEELRQRFEYIAAQANDAAALAAAERAALAGRIDDKAARGEALAAHREALLAEMQSLRHQMQRQEEYLRSSLARMRQLGAVDLPEEVVRSLEAVQLAGPLMAGAMLGSGRAPPQLLLEGVPEEEAGEWPQPGSGGGSGLATPKAAAAKGRQGRGRRPKSAGPTPRTKRGVSPAIGGSYSARVSPTAGLAVGGSGGGGKGGRAAAGLARPVSAGSASGTASPATPMGPSSPSGGASPYAPYNAPQSTHQAQTQASRTPKPPAALDAEVAAKADTSERAAEAAASGRYTAVHEVARPGSRREEELRVVLQEEIAKESERQGILAKVTDDDERARLVKFFTLEREEARRRILALSSAAQAALYH